MSVNIKIRRFHLIFAVFAFVFLGAIALISSRESSTSLKEELPASAVLPLPLPIRTPAPLPVAPAAAARAQKAPAPGASSSVPQEKWIALTFDDGPHPKFTERLLKILRDQGVQATFFVVGRQVELHPELLQKIFDEGHELGNHTYSHPDLRNLSGIELTAELDKTHALVESITQQNMKFFRPPGGRYNLSVVRAAGDLGYTMALWTVFPQDHTRPPVGTLRNRILKAAGNGGVVLLHSGVESTMDALPGIISDLKKRGYRFATLSQMRGLPSASSPSPFLRLASKP